MVTTVHHALAAYDRIIFCGDQFVKIVIPNSAQTFRYNEQEEFKAMDHGNTLNPRYPVTILTPDKSGVQMVKTCLVVDGSVFKS